MTQEIIEMARQSGCFEKHKVFYFVSPELETFAKLVAAKEREVVAVFLEKECDEQYLADRVRSREFNGAEKWMK